MSYDLAVFDPQPQLRDRAAFMSWYDTRTEWADGLDYNEPSNASAALQRWFQEIIVTFPPLNGRLRPGDFATNEWTADYSIASDLICVAFPSSKSGPAHEVTRHLASKHGVGFFDASGDGGAWFPTVGGTLELAHATDRSDAGMVGLERLLRQLGRGARSLDGEPANQGTLLERLRPLASPRVATTKAQRPIDSVQEAIELVESFAG